ncbi:SIMPL domain-containing protein [Bartonella gabonensis]|uniref:SIMPL domain-containing protein n=1 Tax=Bartonella gabonensis TaxID=2699889 RepID=UPI00158AB54C|nr:SIMPL domain-containing protein [Bartonella gabonensis]
MIKIIFKPLKYCKVKIAIMAFALLATSFPIHAEQSKMKNATIEVVATGESFTAPDMVTIDLAVVTEKKTAQKALNANNKSMNDIVNTLKNNNIHANDLQISGLSLHPFTPDNHQEEKKNEQLYRVTNFLTVHIRDLANTGKILDQIIALGVNKIDGINFTNADPNPFYKESRKKAIVEAIKKAETIAQAANVKLGKIIKIVEDNFHPMPNLTYQALDGTYKETTLSEGQRGYSVAVTVTFSID